MPRKSSAPTASSNGKASSPVPSEPAQTQEKLQQIEAEIKAETKAKKPPIEKPIEKPVEPVKPAPEATLKGIEKPAQTVPTVQELPTSKSFTQSLDEFFESKAGRLIQTIGTVFIMSIPAYSFGFSDGLLKGLEKAHSLTQASEVAPTPQATATPAVPAAVPAVPAK